MHILAGIFAHPKGGVMRAVDINRLVVIDADVEDISLLHDVLMDLCATAECESFSDPCIAIEKLRSRTGDLPQLVIIDFHMLTLNGLECPDSRRRAILRKPGSRSCLRWICRATYPV